jgi:hypothetical protein
MIVFSPEDYINATLKVGVVYKFDASDIIGTDVPHYFVVVAIDEDDNYLVVSTTQREKKEEYFKNAGLDLSTLVYVKNDTYNGLTENSYINCNDKYHISRDRLIQKRAQGVLSCMGEISYNHYEQIRSGIKSSKLNDLPEELLIHPIDDL